MALFAAMAASCVLTAILDVVVARTTGFDPFTLSYWFVLPVGAFLVGAMACSGAIGASYFLHVRPSRADAAAMVAMGFACMGMILFLAYWTYVLPDGRHGRDVVDFWRFTDITTRAAHMKFGRSLQNDMGEVGAFGYVELGLQAVAFLFGGFGAYALIGSLPACQSCPSYLRKVRQTSSGELPVNQADHLLGIMKGDLKDVHNVVAWKAPDGGFKAKDKRARLTYRLYECPRCKLEVVTADAEVHDGRAWKQVSNAAVRRNLAAETTLWTAFK